MRLLLVSVLTLGAVGCGSCEPSAAPPSTTTGPSAMAAREPSTEGRTEDGLRVISAPNRTQRRLEREASERETLRERLVLEPTSPDPHEGSFSIDEAVEGLGTDGPLIAEINTSFGTILCELDTRRTPNTVANFVGLARGRRQWWDASAGQWRRNLPFYRGRKIYRVIPEGWIQGGDLLDDGTVGVGYTIPDEPNGVSHDRAGQLCMASSGPDQNGSTFLITDGPRPDLDADARYTVFGRCDGSEDIVRRLARVPQGPENRPLTPVEITNVRVRRVRGGLENARPTPPRLPDGVADGPRGASPPPGAEASGMVPNAPLSEEERQQHIEQLRREIEARRRTMPGQGIHDQEAEEH